MRAELFTLLSTDVTLTNIVADRIYPVNMEDVKPDTPFIVYTFSTAGPRLRVAKEQIVQFWAHDGRGDYTQIDEILARIKVLLLNKTNEGLFYQANWLNDSNDLFDETLATINRFSRFELILKEPG